MTPLPSKALERAYGLQIDEAVKVRNAYRLATDRGTIFLKRSRLTVKELNFVTGALLHLAERGFDRAPLLVRTLDGAAFCQLHGENYLLNEWREGRECDFDRAEDAVATASLLADFHKAAAGFHPPPGELRIRYGAWPNTFRRRLRDLDLFARLAGSRSEPTAFDLEFLARVEEQKSYGEEALRWLLASGYPGLVFMARRDRTLCHHDLAHHNVLREPSGRVSFVDFDYAIADLRVHDLANLLRRLLKRQDWAPGQAFPVLEQYDTECRLLPAEFETLAVLLWWPQEFWQVSFQYYVERQPWPLDRFVDSIRKKSDRPPAQRTCVERLREQAGCRRR